MIFDTHAHYDDAAFDDDRERLLEKMQDRGVEYIVNAGTSVATCKSTIGLVRRFPYVYGALGFHPDEVAELKEEDFTWLSRSIHKPKIVAVGEIGLDFHWNSNKEEQIEWFERQIELAKSANLPVVVHSRDAAAETYETLKRTDAGSVGGIIHCFSYSPEMAKKFIDLGFYLGIGGVVTFKNAKKLTSVVNEMPVEKMVLETDCPYMAPEPNRGKRSDSFMLPYVVNKIAQIKGLLPSQVIDITTENAKNLYGIGRRYY